MKFSKRPHGTQDLAAMQRLSFEFGGKIWVYSSSTDQEIRFKVQENGGDVAKTFFRRWLKDFNYTQTILAEELNKSLGVKWNRSYISLIASGHRRMPDELRDFIIRKYEERKAKRRKAQQRLEEEYVRAKKNEVHF